MCSKIYEHKVDLLLFLSLIAKGEQEERREIKTIVSRKSIH